jgi:hypothetical protein
MPVEERRKPIHGAWRRLNAKDGVNADFALRQGWRVLGQCRSNCRGAKICPCRRHPRQAIAAPFFILKLGVADQKVHLTPPIIWKP